jgi:hypothetical protein
VAHVVPCSVNGALRATQRANDWTSGAPASRAGPSRNEPGRTLGGRGFEPSTWEGCARRLRKRALPRRWVSQSLRHANAKVSRRRKSARIALTPFDTADSSLFLLEPTQAMTDNQMGPADLFALVTRHLGYRRKSFGETILPGSAERVALGLAVLGIAMVAVAWLMKLAEVPYGVFLLLGAFLVPLSGLVYLLAGAVRDVGAVWRGASEPAGDLDPAFVEFQRAVDALSSRPSEELELALAFVGNQMSIIRSRAGFLTGAIDHIGMLPLAIAAWWAWRSSGSPVEFSTLEMWGLGFVAGVHFGLLLVRSRLDMLSRIQNVLEQSIRRQERAGRSH